MTPDDEDDTFTELVDGVFWRVDLVDKSANGHRFLIAKSAGGVVPADAVRALIAKANTKPQAVFDQKGRLLGIVDPKDVQEVDTGEPVAAKAPTKAADALANETEANLAVTKSEVTILTEANRRHRAAEDAAHRGDLTPVGMMLEKRRAAEQARTQIQRLRAEQRTAVAKARAATVADRDSAACRRRHGLG